jgi:hypothetical protein
MFFLKDGEFLLSSIGGMDWDTLSVPENSSFFCDSNLIYIHDKTFEPYRIFASIDSAQTFTFLQFLTHEINEIKQGNILHTKVNPSILGLSCAVNDTLTFGPKMTVWPLLFMIEIKSKLLIFSTPQIIKILKVLTGRLEEIK